MTVKIKQATYNKLVRDKIPDIIEQSGNQCETAIFSDQDYQQALRQKLIEEATEVAQAQKTELVEELADLYEVIDCLLMATGINPETVLAEQKKKREERGSFQEKIQLRSVLIQEK